MKIGKWDTKLWNTNNIPNGDYTLKAIATDDKGNEGTSGEVCVVVTN